MKLLGYAFLFILAAGLVTALALGVAVQLVWYGLLALIVVGVVTFIAKKVRGSSASSSERLPR
jgi:hypothetical protein